VHHNIEAKNYEGLMKDGEKWVKETIETFAIVDVLVINM